MQIAQLSRPTETVSTIQISASWARLRITQQRIPRADLTPRHMSVVQVRLLCLAAGSYCLFDL